MSLMQLLETELIFCNLKMLMVLLVHNISKCSSAVASNTSSDERLKENIIDASPQLDIIKQVQVREFDWKKNGNHQVGIIAQEVK
jgi:hypothetical protein